MTIDFSFVIETTQAPERPGLVSTGIQLAHSLKLEAPAEILKAKFLAQPPAG